MPTNHTLLTPTKIAKRSLVLLENALAMGNNVHRAYKEEFVDPKAGGSVNIRKPVRFRATKSRVRSDSDVLEYNTGVDINTQAHVAWKFNTQDLTLTIEEYTERYIKPAIVTLADTVDLDLTGLYSDINNQVGTPGTTPSTFAHIGAAMQRLDELAAPRDNRKIIVDPAAQWSVMDGLKGLFDTKRVRDVVNRGYLGQVANAEVHMDQNIRKHTVGAHGGTPRGNGAPAAGATQIVTDGWTASTAVLKAGDVFTIAGVKEVNPVNGQSTGTLKQFVSLTDVTSDGTGNATITVYPAGDSGPGLQFAGAYQNCSIQPPDNGAITVVGTASTEYPQNLVFQQNAFALVTCPLNMPQGVWGERATSKLSGLSIRIIKDYDSKEDEEIVRLDILYGVKTLYPDLGVRLVG